MDTPWTNGKIEPFWGDLQSELLDRQQLPTLAAASRPSDAYATYYNYDRLHGAPDWHTPAERYDGTPFTDQRLRARAVARAPPRLAVGADAGMTGHVS